MAWPFVIALWLIATPATAPTSGPATDSPTTVDAAIFQNRLITLDQTGAFHVWSISDGSPDEQAAARLARKGLTHIAVDRDRLWAAGEMELCSWSSATSSWEAAASFHQSPDDSILALVCISGAPVLIYSGRIDSPTTHQSFKVPEQQGQVSTDKLRLSSVHVSGRILWLGTGHGEWGGNLLGLDTASGKWVQYADDLHYVTGIATLPGKGDPVVCWSMSHFQADTMVRVHKSDASPETSYREIEDEYFQRIVYSSYDHAFFAIAAKGLVTINEGKPTPVATLKASLFGRESMAIGVAPGVVRLLPVRGKTLIIVPAHGPPIQVTNGQVSMFRSR